MRLENSRLEGKVSALQKTIGLLRSRQASLANGGLQAQMLSSRKKSSTPWLKSIGQTIVDDNNPLYDATPADKMMDPEERPFLRGPEPRRGDLAHQETVSFWPHT